MASEVEISSMSTQILVVDDEKELADVLELYLTNDGYTVHKCHTGADALDCMEHADLDCLFYVRGLRYHRPGGNGHCRRVQNSRGRPLAEPGSVPGLSRDLGDAGAEKDRPNCRECRDVCPPGRYDAGGLPENAQLWENRSFPGAVLLRH